MSRLRIYTIHIKPGLAEPYEHAEFVEEGFNWYAFFFTGLWLLYKRLWWQAALVIALSGVLGFLKVEEAMQPMSIALLQVTLGILVGYHANDWVRAKLKRSAYIVADIVSGENILRAEQRFFDRFTASKQQHQNLYS
jgi:hypothetical protein